MPVVNDVVSTCAPLILFLTFTSMATAPDTDTKIAATGLAARILFDATASEH